MLLEIDCQQWKRVYSLPSRRQVQHRRGGALYVICCLFSSPQRCHLAFDLDPVERSISAVSSAAAPCPANGSFNFETAVHHALQVEFQKLIYSYILASAITIRALRSTSFLQSPSIALRPLFPFASGVHLSDWRQRQHRMEQPPSNVQDGSSPTQQASQLYDASATQASRPVGVAATSNSPPAEPENDNAWMSEMVQSLLHTEVQTELVLCFVSFPQQLICFSPSVVKHADQDCSGLSLATTHKGD